jgi:hypothetical protein
VGVEVLEILAQHDVEVALSGDQEVVEAFPAQGSDEAFCDRVRPWRLDRGADDLDVGAGEDGVEGGCELAVSVADQESEPVGTVAEVHQQVAGLLGDPGAGGMGGDPGDVHAAAVVLDHGSGSIPRSGVPAPPSAPRPRPGRLPAAVRSGLLRPRSHRRP